MRTRDLARSRVLNSTPLTVVGQCEEFTDGDWGEIWHGGPTVPSSMPNFTHIERVERVDPCQLLHKASRRRMRPFKVAKVRNSAASDGRAGVARH